MTNAVLYVFYTSPRTCALRLKLMRSINPNVRFYGICTDRPENIHKFKPVFDELDDAWVFPFVNPKWHWHNLDKVVCTWFVERGANLPFDRLLVLDWDVLLLNPVSTWTSLVDERSAKFIDVWENTQPENNHWTRSTNEEFVSFCARYDARNGTRPVIYNAFLFAYVVPRRAFTDCAQEVLGYAGYCEYRLPTILRSYGYDLENLPRPQNWYKFANVKGISITAGLILDEMARPDGFRLFHPVFEPYHSSDLWMSLPDRIAARFRYRNVSRLVKEVLKRCLRRARSWRLDDDSQAT